MTFEELKEKGIPCWPDNDGGLWYYNPITHITETVKEN